MFLKKDVNKLGEERKIWGKIRWGDRNVMGKWWEEVGKGNWENGVGILMKFVLVGAIERTEVVEIIDGGRFLERKKNEEKGETKMRSVGKLC